MLKTGFLVDRQRAWCIHKLIDVEQLQIHMQIALFMACIWNAQKLSPDRNVFESFECFECFEWRCQMSCKWRVSLYLCLIPLLSKFSSIDWFATVGNNFGADQSICYTRNDIFYSCFFFFLRVPVSGAHYICYAILYLDCQRLSVNCEGPMQPIPWHWPWNIYFLFAGSPQKALFALWSW